ncbi:MAG TPA: hypothetical protein DDZ76_09010 [Xanthomonadales bacterium]|nr:hypothetical protein [Xanthomonadales bacterium]
MDNRLVEFAEAAIRSFLIARPDSADTVDGIHRWWIQWPGLAESPVVTQIALERLEQAGEVEHFRIGTSILWRRPRRAESGGCE